MKCLTLFLLIAALAIQGCNFNRGEVVHGDQIDQATRTEINNLDVAVFQSIQLEDYDAFSKLIAPSLKKELADAGNKEAWKSIGQILEHKSYRQYDEINVNSLLPNYHFSTALGDSTNVVVSMNTTSRETEISFLMVEDSISQFLMAAIYGKYSDKWLLSGFSIGCYSYLGKSAQAYYRQAKQFYERGDLVDAVVNVSMCARCSHPCKTIVKYKNATAMERLTDKIITDAQAKYHFPITLNSIKTKPVISGIEPHHMGGELLPEIDYLSLKISDTLALKKENEEVQKAVTQLFQGVKENNAHIYYHVSGALPGKDKQTHFYNFIEATDSKLDSN